VLAALKKKMDELGVLLVPSVSGHNVSESAVEYIDKDSGHVNKRTITYFTELDMVMTWVNADEPKETIPCQWYGQGVDIAGEKGVGKAMTYAEKYFMLKFFNIPTDKDDPDSFQEKSNPDDKPKAPSQTKLTEAPKNTAGISKCEDCQQPIATTTEQAAKVKSWCKSHPETFGNKILCQACQGKHNAKKVS